MTVHKPSENIAGERLSSYEEGLLRAINQYRTGSGLKSLVIDGHLRKLAKRHSIFMGRHNSLNHVDFNKRFKESKRSCCVENVGWDYSTPESQFKAWKTSNVHNKNLLHSQIKYAGIARVGDFVTFFACS